MTTIEIGRLLRAGTTGFVVGCRVSQLDSPTFGGLVRVPLGDGYQVYGLIHDIHIDDDGIVRQLVTADNVDAAIIADNRVNRNVPVEISVLTVGYQQNGQIKHLLPPRPPLSFRHILRASEAPIGELLAAHIEQANAAHMDGGDSTWAQRATQELIAILRDDYATLMAVLGAVGDVTALEGGN